MNKKTVEERADVFVALSMPNIGKPYASSNLHYANGLKCSYLAGFRDRDEEVKGLREALEYYANEKNWYDTSGNGIRMVIASLDTEGQNWLGGRAARQALSRIPGEENKG